MGGEDKLAVEIGGRPLLAWTLGALAAAPAVGPDRRGHGGRAARGGGIRRVAPGHRGRRGRRRRAAAGIGPCRVRGPRSRRRPTTTGVVLVHDAARPLIGADLVAAVAEATARHGAAIPIVPVAETLKRIDGDLVGATVERSGLGAAQTPQGVRRDLLREAYRRFPADGPDTFTDEAALLEACSIPVHVVPGDPGNLKVTLPADLRRVAPALGAVPARPRRASATTAIRSGRAVRCAWAGWRSTGAPRPGRSLGRRCRPPCRRRRAARGGRPGRSRAPVPGRRPHPARHRQRGPGRRGPATRRRRRLATGERRPDRHRRPAAARALARPDARPDRGSPRARPGRRSTSRPRPATSTGPRAPAGRSRRSWSATVEPVR